MAQSWSLREAAQRSSAFGETLIVPSPGASNTVGLATTGVAETLEVWNWKQRISEPPGS